MKSSEIFRSFFYAFVISQIIQSAPWLLPNPRLLFAKWADSSLLAHKTHVQDPEVDSAARSYHTVAEEFQCQ